MTEPGDVVVKQNVKEESSSNSIRSCSCMSLSAATRKRGNKWKGSSFYNRCVNKISFLLLEIKSI